MSEVSNIQVGAAQAAPAHQPAAAETPSQAIVSAASERATHRDARGRIIEVKRLNALDLYRLTKILGETSRNQQALNMAMTVCSVTAINGEPISPAASEREVEALIARLDIEGLSGAGLALQKLAASTEDEVRDAAKNS